MSNNHITKETQHTRVQWDFKINTTKEKAYLRGLIREAIEIAKSEWVYDGNISKEDIILIAEDEAEKYKQTSMEELEFYYDDINEDIVKEFSMEVY